MKYCTTSPPSLEEARRGAFRIHHPSHPTKYVLVRDKTFYFARQIAATLLQTDAQGLEGWFLTHADLVNQSNHVVVKGH
jgi:hypothetical protein